MPRKQACRLRNVSAARSQVVFEAGANGLPVVMVPLEVTHTALATEDVLRKLLVGAGVSPGPTPFRAFVHDMMVFFRSSYSEVFGFKDPPLHDPCAVAYVAAPFLFTTKAYRVDVEVSSPLSAGQTVVDVWAQSKKAPNVRVAVAMDVPRFWEIMLAAVGEADRRSPLNGDRRAVPAAEL